jgi:hypothetical protein
MLIIAPANISLLNDVYAWFIVPLIADGRFLFIPPMGAPCIGLSRTSKRVKEAVNIAIYFNI